MRRRGEKVCKGGRTRFLVPESEKVEPLIVQLSVLALAMHIINPF